MPRDLSTPEKRAAYNAYIRKWRRENPEKQKAIERRWHKKQAALIAQEEREKEGGDPRDDVSEVPGRECERPDCDGNRK